MLMKRPMTSVTLFACTVVKTRCPVSADWMAICAVSLSRISPTMILSGSCRKMERNPRANVSPFFSLTGICVIPRTWYSTGSSIVMILSSSFLISLIAAYSVVVLPDPVGPESSLVFVVESGHIERQVAELLAQRLFVEYAQNGVFTVHRRHDRHAKIDKAPLVSHAETAVLWNAALGDVQLAHDLNARKNRRVPFLRQRLHRVLQHAVNAV